MKRISGLFDGICDRTNLSAAVWAAARGRREQPDVAEFLCDADRQLNQISADLLQGTFRFQRYREFAVHDTKSRTIRAPTFRDRVVHHAMINVVGPVLERSAIEQSYACRRGKGQHAALHQARQWTRRGQWYGKLDFRKYYDSVNHDLLRLRLRRRFAERQLLELFDLLLNSWCSQPGAGLPIGALTSQYLGNFFLDAFDARMKSSGICRRYVRYMDDIVIWNSKCELPAIRELSQAAAADLRLEIKHAGEWNSCEFGVPFLGFIVYPGRLRLGRQARRRFRRKLRTVRREFAAGRLNELQYQARLTSLFAHGRIADDANWRRSVLLCQSGSDD